MSRPSVGRIVHYTNLGDGKYPDRDGKYPPQVIAAIITRVMPDPYGKGDSANERVSLTTFYPTGTFNLDSVEYTPEPAGSEAARGKWTWPERV